MRNDFAAAFLGLQHCPSVVDAFIIEFEVLEPSQVRVCSRETFYLVFK
jgi:hypothetical protein